MHKMNWFYQHGLREGSGIWEGQTLTTLRQRGFFPIPVFCEGDVTFVDIAVLLNADGFTPLGQYAGKTTWATYVQILNFPPQYRTKWGFTVCTDLIFGPKQPKLFDIFYRKLVDELVGLFNNGEGVLFHSESGLVRSRVFAVGAAMDLRALQKAAALWQDPSPYVCPYCHFAGSRVGKSTAYGFFSERRAVTRTHEHWINVAPLETTEDAKRKSGYHRLTEFSRLPYIDLPKFWLCDAMHLIYLGVCRRLLRNIGCAPQQTPARNDADDVNDVRGRASASDINQWRRVQPRTTTSNVNVPICNHHVENEHVGERKNSTNEDEEGENSSDSDFSDPCDGEEDLEEQSSEPLDDWWASPITTSRVRSVLPATAMFQLDASGKKTIEKRLAAILFPLKYSGAGARPKNVISGSGKGIRCGAVLRLNWTRILLATGHGWSMREINSRLHLCETQL